MILRVSYKYNNKIIEWKYDTFMIMLHLFGCYLKYVMACSATFGGEKPHSNHFVECIAVILSTNHFRYKSFQLIGLFGENPLLFVAKASYLVTTVTHFELQILPPHSRILSLSDRCARHAENRNFHPQSRSIISLLFGCFSWVNFILFFNSHRWTKGWCRISISITVNNIIVNDKKKQNEIIDDKNWLCGH